MVVKELLDLPDGAQGGQVYNCYTRVLESYKCTLDAMPDSQTVPRQIIESKYRQLESARREVQTDTVNTAADSEGGEGLFYDALYRLHIGSDITDCKKAVSILKNYLNDNPGSVMGNTLMQIIEDSFEEPVT